MRKSSVNSEKTQSNEDRIEELYPKVSIITNFSSPSSMPQFASTNIDENGYVFDGVKVEIEDVDNTSLSNITTQSLKRCKKQVLKHYYSLLCFIGWRPFCKEDFYAMPTYCHLINFFYPVLILLFLIYAYVYEILVSCDKLDTLYDFKDSSLPTIHLWNIQRNSTKLPTSTKKEALNNSVSTSTSFSKKFMESDITVGHITMIFIIPSLMHLSAYIMGFIYFRIRENEQLYALMEKVFLSVNQSMKQVSQDKVIKRLKLFIFFGLFWTIITISLHMYRALVNVEDFKRSWPLFLIQLIALILIYAIYLAVVINHGTQCEMIIFYVQEIRTRLDEKSITIKDAMQQILDTRVSIGNLNSTISKMTTLVGMIFMEKIINVSIILIEKRPQDLEAWLYWSFNLLSWILISLFSIIQVARLNSECDRFKQIAISARVYGYHACSRDELDSFLLFVANSKLRGKLYGINFRSHHILTSVIVLMFIIIILMESSLMSTLI